MNKMRDRRLPLRFWVIRRDYDQAVFPGKAIADVWTARDYVPLDAEKHPPRLFTWAGTAKQALDCWLQGEWSRDDADIYEAGIPVPPANPFNALAITRQQFTYSVVEVKLTFGYTVLRKP